MMRPALRLLALSFAALTGTPALAQAVANDEADIAAREQEAKAKLSKLRADIDRVLSLQSALQEELKQAQSDLREADEAVQKQSAAQRHLQADAQAQQAALQNLESRRAASAAGLQAQREDLAQMLRSAFRLGQHQQLRLLLSQDRLSAASRVLEYHRYVQRDQLARVRKLMDELHALAELTEATRVQNDQVTQAMLAAEVGLQALAQQRAERESLLDELRSRQRDHEVRLKNLRHDEQALQTLLETLRDVFADIPEQLQAEQSMAARRGRLPMPAAGPVLSSFGAGLPDGRRSEGWLIGTAAGAPVKAIAHGRVAFAEWMNGYGLLLILDHGDGYLSLYAHNDALLREPGDWVEAGDPIAEAGSSGGQSRPALYFELRRNGQPVDPRQWLRR